MSEIKAPFSKSQVNRLNKAQTNRLVHPYTCNKSVSECEVNQEPRDYSKDGILIATREGWICPCGKYKQDWAHEFSLEFGK